MRFDQPRRGEVVLVLLLAAAERAGLTPLDVRAVHSLAYLHNVLAPVWHLPPMDGKILKSDRGAHYPELQRDLDRLVGRGVVEIRDLSHYRDGDGNWHLGAAYDLRPSFARPIVAAALQFEEEARRYSFLVEICLALSGLSNADVARGASLDATYSDPLTSVGNVVDFDEWQSRNLSAAIADRFNALVPAGIHLNDAEEIHLYLRHLRERIAS